MSVHPPAPRRAEIVDLRTLEKECSFFREVERKTSQVDAPLVNLSLGEIRVVAEGADEIRGEVLVDIEAAVPLIIRPAGVGVPPQASNSAVGFECDSGSELEVFDPPELGRLGGIVEEIILLDTGQADRLLLSGNIALHVNSPGVKAGSEGDRLERDPDLGRPAVRLDPAPGVPDPVPVEAGVLAEGQPLAPRAAGVDGKDIGVPLVLKGVQQNPDGVFAAAFLITVVGHQIGRDLGGFAVITVNANVQAVMIIENAEFRFFGRIPHDGEDHPEIGEKSGPAPDLVIEPPVEARGLFNADGRLNRDRREERYRDPEKHEPGSEYPEESVAHEHH